MAAKKNAPADTGDDGRPGNGTATAGPGHNSNLKNNPEVHKAIADGVARINALKEERRSINADIKAVREGLQARGLNRHALADAERFFNMDKTQRQGYDDSLAIARQALDLPIQPALFDTPPPVDKAAGEGAPATTH